MAVSSTKVAVDPLFHFHSSNRKMELSPRPSSSSSSMRPKARSKACLHCRRRKMRCDGVRPACFQCIRADRSTECEYGDDSKKSDTQILYERLSSLEKRYRDLQAIKRKDSPSGRMRGTSRGGGGAQLSRSNSMPGHDKPPRSRLSSRRNGQNVSGYNSKESISAQSSPLARSDSPHSELSDGSYGQTTFAHKHGAFFDGIHEVHSYDESSSGFPEQSADQPFGLSQLTASRLIAVFASHAQQTGISLVVECQSFHCGKFPKAVMPLLFLWAIHFSKDPELQQHKAEFLDLSLDSLSGLLREPLGAQSGDPNHVESIYNLLLAILIHTSLATYFFAHGRMLEGNYHSNNASQLAICAGLHRTADPKKFHTLSTDGASSTNSPGAGLLPRPRTLKDAVFRQYQFWNTFVLDRSWSAVSGAPSPSWRWGSAGLGLMSSEGVLNERSARTAIKAPWPEDNTTYANTTTTSQFASDQPVDDFLAGIDLQASSSIYTLRAKSAALFEASSRISSLVDSSTCSSTSDIFLRFQSTLSTFLVNIPILPNSNAMQLVSFEKSSLITTHTMTHAAVIRLNLSTVRKAYQRQSVLPFHMTTIEEVAGSDPPRNYERLLGNSPISATADADYNSTHGSSSSLSGVVPTGAVNSAEVQICLASAREIVHIIGYLGPEDYEYCEPIIACCWELAGEVLLQEIRVLGLPNSHLHKFQQPLSELGIIESALRCLGETFPVGKINADKLTSRLRKAIDLANAFV